MEFISSEALSGFEYIAEDSKDTNNDTEKTDHREGNISLTVEDKQLEKEDDINDLFPADKSVISQNLLTDDSSDLKNIADSDYQETNEFSKSETKLETKLDDSRGNLESSDESVKHVVDQVLQNEDDIRMASTKLD